VQCPSNSIGPPKRSAIREALDKVDCVNENWSARTARPPRLGVASRSASMTSSGRITCWNSGSATNGEDNFGPPNIPCGPLEAVRWLALPSQPDPGLAIRRALTGAPARGVCGDPATRIGESAGWVLSTASRSRYRAASANTWRSGFPREPRWEHRRHPANPATRLGRASPECQTQTTCHAGRRS
jgi:hypothetical protein